jgi:hypothetical protein
MAMHIYQPPPSLIEIEGSITPAAEGLVLSMLAKDPNERPAMAKVVTELERIGAAATQALPVVRNSLSHQHLNPVPVAVGFEGSGNMNPSRPSLAVVGQTQDPTKIKSGATRLKRILIPAAMTLVLSGIGIVVVLRQGDSDSGTGKGRRGATSAQRKVVWEVKSTPPGVEVVRVTDGAVLGKTPWHQEEPAGTGKVGVTLRFSGYIDKQVLLDKDKDCSEDVQLDPVPPADTPPTVAPDDNAEQPSTRPHRQKKPGKTKTEAPKNDDDLAPVH